MKMILEDWALRHDYHHHSNPKNKDRAKIFFDKAFVRPLLNEAFEVIKSDTKDFNARKRAKNIIDTLNSKSNGQDNSLMLCGRLVQQCADKVLINNIPESMAMEDMLEAYEGYTPRAWDKGVDNEKYHLLKDTLVSTAKNAMVAIKEATHLENRITPEVDLYAPMVGNVLPYFTKPDYNRKVELKTKWLRLNARSKQGYSSASLPKSFGMFEKGALWQVAGVYALNNNQLPQILYVNDSDYVIFNAQNCDELKHENLISIIDKITKFNKVTENILRKARDKEELFSFVYPDYDNICWGEPPTYLKHANIVFDEGFNAGVNIDYEKFNV